jgi:hypothetical protein
MIYAGKELYMKKICFYLRVAANEKIGYCRAVVMVWENELYLALF